MLLPKPGRLVCVPTTVSSLRKGSGSPFSIVCALELLCTAFRANTHAARTVFERFVFPVCAHPLRCAPPAPPAALRTRMLAASFIMAGGRVDRADRLSRCEALWIVVCTGEREGVASVFWRGAPLLTPLALTGPVWLFFRLAFRVDDLAVRANICSGICGTVAAAAEALELPRTAVAEEARTLRVAFRGFGVRHPGPAEGDRGVRLFALSNGVTLPEGDLGFGLAGRFGVVEGVRRAAPRAEGLISVQ